MGLRGKRFLLVRWCALALYEIREGMGSGREAALRMPAGCGTAGVPQPAGPSGGQVFVYGVMITAATNPPG